MAASKRLQRWWEKGNVTEGKQGRIVMVQGRDVTIECPVCKDNPVVYNGNYFCDGWGYTCHWALPHPATRKRDREICDLIGVDYL